jgi:hypothetical protein
MLSIELRELLLNGAGLHLPTPAAVLRLGGAAHVRAQWRRHRSELMAACSPGRRPYAFWAIELGLNPVPIGEVAQLRAIRGLAIYADDNEKALVHRRLDEIAQGRKMVRHALRRVA